MSLFSSKKHNRNRSSIKLEPSSFSTHEKNVSFFSFECAWQIPQLRQLYGQFLARNNCQDSFLFVEHSTAIQQCIQSLVHRTTAAHQNEEEHDFFSGYLCVMDMHTRIVNLFLKTNSIHCINASRGETKLLATFDWKFQKEEREDEYAFYVIEEYINILNLYVSIIQENTKSIVYLLESDTFPRFAKSAMLNDWLNHQKKMNAKILQSIIEIDRDSMYSVSARDVEDYIGMLSNDDSLWKVYKKKKNLVQYVSTRAGQFGGRMFKTRVFLKESPEQVIAAQFMPQGGYESYTLERIPAKDDRFATLINYTLVGGKMAFFPKQDFVVRSTSYTYRDQTSRYECLILALAVEYPVMPRFQGSTRMTGNTGIYIRGRGPSSVQRASSSSNLSSSSSNSNSNNNSNSNSNRDFSPPTSTSPHSYGHEQVLALQGTDLVIVTDYRLSQFGVLANFIGSFLALTYVKMLKRSMREMIKAGITIENVHKEAVHPDMMNLMTKEEYLSLSKPVI